jgi:hypothetical protein
MLDNSLTETDAIARSAGNQHGSLGNYPNLKKYQGPLLNLGIEFSEKRINY